jgi:hypothetical protein
LQLAVQESYPNCPKYIQRRQLSPIDDIPPPPLQRREGTVLESEQQLAIASADTFFVASAHPERGVDVSHRGGNPGFIRILDERTLRIPDYAGNSMFNTLGNFVGHPRAGLVFLDFERHRLLQLTGNAEILWHLDDPMGAAGGTHRFWTFTIAGWIETELPQSLGWKFLDYSPFNPSYPPI